MANALQPIIRRVVSEPDRAAVQDAVLAAVVSDPERFLSAYVRQRDAFGGRYVCADLMKDTIPEYSASREARGRFNGVVHNSAAVLAAEQFRRAVAAASQSGPKVAVFLTGMPGAGKTARLLAGGSLPDAVGVVFEGQMVDAAMARQKVGLTIEAGLAPVVEAVLARPEDALENTLRRFNEFGRGAGIDVMARIQEGTPAGLRALMDAFGDRLEVSVHDLRDRSSPVTHVGKGGINTWERELAYGPVRQRLADHLERLRAAGAVSDDGYRQAVGLPPLAGIQGLASAHERGGQGDA